ncbi:hypothetical protein ACWKSP_39520 [Micromonosporaceae bacterium Da 78-11]
MAADQVDRLVSLSGWREALPPDATDLHLGVRPVFRPAARVDRRRTSDSRPDRRSVDARMGNARLDVPIEVPQEWVALPVGAFRGFAIAAILDGLRHLGTSIGVGPPGLRQRPLKAPDTAGLSATEQAKVEKWVEVETDALPPGSA